MLLRLSVKINLHVESDLTCSTARSKAYNSARRIFGYPGGLTTMLVCERPLNTMECTIFL